MSGSGSSAQSRSWPVCPITLKECPHAFVSTSSLGCTRFSACRPRACADSDPEHDSEAPGTTTAPTTQPSAAQAAQQERMAACNAESGQKKLSGD
jgi:hypothetical protein